MTVKFSAVERGNPANPEAPKKYYPSVQSTGRVTLRDLAKSINAISTVSTPDTMAVLEALLATIPGELSRGNIVELGDFGNFWLRNTADGVEASEDVRSNQITNLMPRFIPGKEFRKALNVIEFERV